MVFVDGRHDPFSTRDDLRWADLLPPGGRVLVHDSFSSVGVTLALLGVVLPSRTLALPRPGRQPGDVRAGATRPRATDGACCASCRGSCRNVGLKILLRLRLRPLARLVGHHDVADPY